MRKTLKISLLIWLMSPPGQANTTTGGSGRRPNSVLSVGDVSACALLTNGTAECWGADDFGQLGVGSADVTLHSPAPVVGVSAAVAIGMGRYAGCALGGNGEVQCWGSNGRGWLGDGTTNDRFTAAPVMTVNHQPLVGVKALSVGSNHSCAVNGAGSVFCWGDNSNGQLGDGTNVDRSFATPAIGSGFVDVSVGPTHTCALASTGKVWCWGNNSNGQLGDGTQTNSLVPLQSLVANARAVSAGATHSCAVLADGTVACWGSNQYLETGSCGKGACMISTANGMTNAKAVSAGDQYTCALSASGNVYCWGRNDANQLGGAAYGAVGTATFVGTYSGTQSLVAVPMSVVALSSGVASTCAALDNGQVTCWGDNLQGEAGDAARTRFSATAPHLIGFSTGFSTSGLNSAAITAVDGYSSCALQTSRPSGLATAKCWGYNGDGELGNGNTLSIANATGSYTAALPAGPISLSAGGFFNCALLSDGSGQCWGANNNGQLGNGSTTGMLTPVAVSGNLRNAALAISAGYGFALSLESDGSILAWGDNSYGQLGDGTTATRLSPVPVAGSNGAVAVAAGGYHACGLRYDGTVWCWGYNGYGQLGTGNYNNSALAVSTLPLDSKAVAISAGWYHTCALLDNGNIQCWGYNGYGGLGNGSNISTASPSETIDGCAHSVCAANGGALLSGCDNVASKVCASDSYCCSYQWDSICVNEVATLAQEDCAQGVNRAVAMSSGAYDTCAVNGSGRLSCWGYNGYGQLGDNSTTNRANPWQSVILDSTGSISAGYVNSCASRADGTIWCWGANWFGEVGNNSSVQQNTPALVSNFQ